MKIKNPFEPKLPPINLWAVVPAWIFEARRKKGQEEAKKLKTQEEQNNETT